ncbi:MAG TPA: c-type cytochrome [Gemmatales bacterium]|nr:c-type cytochrome [Gemmatales bacterium]
MLRISRIVGGFVLIILLFCAMAERNILLASDPSAGAVSKTPSAERGYELLTTKAFVPAIWSRSSYDSAWKNWNLKEKPSNYEAAVRERYGLHAAPYANDGLPMGLRPTPWLGIAKGVTADCMMCHGGSILGKSYIGLGNASLEIEGLFTELAGLRSDKNELRPILFPFTNVRGTVEAGAMAVYLFSIRNPDLTLRTKPLDLGLRADICEDTPPWWHFKKKTRLYYNGSNDARSVRTLMQFTLSPFYLPAMIKSNEAAFQDIQAYLKTINPPKYSGPIDVTLARKGEAIFSQNCSKCHGTYGENWTYPNKIIDIDEIGTDSTRALAIDDRAKEHYDKTWFAQETDSEGKKLVTSNQHGYVAPPLDGIWATAPYLHNGSVPTLYHLLNSKTRPAKYTRSFRTEETDYDHHQVGWKVTEVRNDAAELAHPIEKRKIYDTSKPGRGNRGHTFGDKLTEEQRWALIEYLKTL